MAQDVFAGDVLVNEKWIAAVNTKVLPTKITAMDMGKVVHVGGAKAIATNDTMTLKTNTLGGGNEKSYFCN